MLSLWASLGPPFGLYTVLYKLLPGFDLIRVPSRLAILTLLAVAILAGAERAGSWNGSGPGRAWP